MDVRAPQGRGFFPVNAPARGIAADSVTAASLIDLFNELFLDVTRTRLVGGAAEPCYYPARPQRPAEVHFRHDYVSSALHEVSHWCIAGRRRRRLEDYGYWYAPDGRSPDEQQAFVSVEARPQALEWVFSKACGVRFHVSIDNLHGPADARSEEDLQTAVAAQAGVLQRRGLPPRATRFFSALCAQFNAGFRLSGADLDVSQLR